MARNTKKIAPQWLLVGALLSLSLLLVSCPAGLSPPVEAGNSVIYDINPTSGSLSFSVELGSTPADLLLTISNPTESSVPNPSIQARASEGAGTPRAAGDGAFPGPGGGSAAPPRAASGTTAAQPRPPAGITAGELRGPGTTAGELRGPARRGHPAAEEFRDNLPPFGSTDAGIAGRDTGAADGRGTGDGDELEGRGGGAGLTPRGGATDNLGDTATFNGVAISSTGTPSVLATNRLVREVGGKTLSIWVANDSWTTTGSKTYLVTDEMVTALADYFLQSGEANDITDWVTPMLGEPWGPHNYSNLIDDDDSVTILLYDIDNDDALPLEEGDVFGRRINGENYRREND